jgi:hypothetical protein
MRKTLQAGGRRRRMLVLTGRRPTRKVRDHSKVRHGGANSNKMSLTTAIVPTAIVPTAIVPTFLHMLNTVKLYHWKTKSFAAHKATDDLYGSLNSKIDEFVEVMLGKDELGGRSKLLNAHVTNLDVFINSEAFIKQIELYKTFLLNLSNDAIFSAPINADLLAIRDEILADFNKLLYLLVLS